MIKYLHYRAFDERTINPQNPAGVLSRTGATVAYAQQEDGTIRYAQAWCGPYDNYNKHMGRAKAGGRLNSDNYAEVATVKDAKEFIELMDKEMFTEANYVRI